MTDQMTYYDWLTANDIVGHLKPLLDRGGHRMREADGRIMGDPVMSPDTPWMHIKHAFGLDCMRWHKVMFDQISARLPAEARFVPSHCQQCWKVVVRPQTVKQLFALEKLQRALNRPSKCGIEIRDTVHGLYGGYFYNTSLQEGLERYQEVREAVTADEHLGPNVQVILKRACTEYEALCGPSDQWKVTEHQLALEQLVERYVVEDGVIREQPEHLQWHIRKRWIEWAYAHGDSTYLHFTGEAPLYKPYVTYQHLAGEPADVVANYLNEIGG